MPLALIAIGAILLVSALRDTYKQLAAQLQADFTGSGNFIYWVLSLIAVGMMGYVPGMSKFSKAFLLLILLGFILSNRGFFAMFTQSIGQGTQTPPPTSPIKDTLPQFNGSAQPGSNSDAAQSAGIKPSNIIQSLGDNLGGGFGL